MSYLFCLVNISCYGASLCVRKAVICTALAPLGDILEFHIENINFIYKYCSVQERRLKPQNPSYPQE